MSLCTLHPAQRPYGGAARTPDGKGRGGPWAGAGISGCNPGAGDCNLGVAHRVRPYRAKTGGSTCSGPGSGTGTAAVPLAWRAYAEGAHTLGLALQSMDPGFDSRMVALLVLARDVHCM